MDPPWARVREGLAELAGSPADVPADGRVGAALALLAESRPPDRGDDGLTLLYTRRGEGLSRHPGQISFPGGGLDPGETVVEGALREAREEVALDPAGVEVLGLLPAFYIPPSRFWLRVVVGRWAQPHELEPNPAEVAEVLPVPLAHLRDPARWRVTRRPERGAMWAWRLDGGHLLWGATAVVTSVLLDLLDPGWRGGADVEDLGADREERPWERSDVTVPRPGPAALAGVPELTAGEVADDAHGPGGSVAQAGRLTAEAAARLLPGAGRRVLVLAGTGRTGAVAVHAAARLVAAGCDVAVRLPAGAGGPHHRAAQTAAALGGRLQAHAGSLPACDLVVDGLVGRGLDGPLRGGPLELVRALAQRSAPVVSIDLPSGVHPRDGFVGEAVSADVTLAVGAPAAGLFAPGLAPFVGDLYVVAADGGDADADPIRRVVAAGEGR